MQLKFETTYDFFTIFIILVKIVLILSTVGHFVLSHSSSAAAEKADLKLVYWKERMEFIFIASMSILLIYHFKPGKNQPISEETSLLFFLFGWFLLFTAKWSIFVKESPWYKRVVSTLN
jgi:hypothetical protein